MMDRRHKGPIRELIRQLELTTSYLKDLNPKEWNNIPIPLQEMSQHMLNFDKNSYSITSLLNTYHEELVAVNYNIFRFAEQSLDEIRE